MVGHISYLLRHTPDELILNCYKTCYTAGLGLIDIELMTIQFQNRLGQGFEAALVVKALVVAWR